jgi:DNA-binding CsgD family transcriptional regulator
LGSVVLDKVTQESRAQALRDLRIPCPRFIGRKDDLKWLEERLVAARRGQGDLVLLAGEAGIGKSRLLREVIDRGQQAEVRVLEGKCSLFEAALPYAPFIEAFRGLLHARAFSEIMLLVGPYAPEVIKLLPELTALMPGIGPNPPLSPPEEKSRLFESLYQVLHRVATDAPLVLALEDVHWADQGSLELLHFLGRRLRRDRWAAVVTYRPEELARAKELARLREDLLRDRLGQELVLKPLSTEEIGELVHEAIGGDPVRLRSLAGLICHSSEGNPFFSEEILRAIFNASDSPLVTFDPTTISAVPIPATVQETIRLRLRQLSSEARVILAAASVLGRTFDLETLQQVADLAGDAFSQPFSELLSLQLVRAERTSRCYGFRHHLIREVVMQQLAPDLRRMLHGRVGLLFEGGEGARAVPQLLAYHFGEAGDRERTVQYALEAASQASAVYAHEDAARYLSLALDALPATATRARLSVAEKLGDARQYALHFEQSLDAFAVMRECAASLDEPHDLVRAYRKIARVQDTMQVGTGLQALERALIILGGIDAPAEEALIRAELSFIAQQTGQFEQAVSEARAGVAAAMRAGNAKTLGRCSRKLGVCLQYLGHHGEARQSLKKAVALARETDDLEGELAALKGVGWCAMEDAKFGTAREAFERANVLFDKVGGGGCYFHAVLGFGELCQLEGKWDEAQSMSHKVVLQLEELGRPDPYAFAALDLAIIYVLRGRFDDAEGLIREAQSAAESSADTCALLYVFNTQARMALARHAPVSAQEWLGRTVDLCERSGFAGAARAEGLLLLTDACVQNGEGARARECLEKAVQAADAFRYLTPWALRVQGLVAAQAGQLDQAIVHYHAALDTLADAPQPYQRGLICRDLGLCHLRRNHQSDRKAARTQLTEALGLFLDLKAQPDADIVRQALHRIGGRVPAGLTLTRREQEVLGFIAEGLSNAAIAGRLYLSERTVEVHVSHILTKLGVQSRSHAVAWVAQRAANLNMQ